MILREYPITVRVRLNNDKLTVVARDHEQAVGIVWDSLRQANILELLTFDVGAPKEITVEDKENVKQ